MSNVVNFRPSKRPSRQQAKQWLAANMDSFPDMQDDIGPNIFHGWRFVRGLDGIIYFANCIEPGICESEFQKFTACSA
jgi:hypothetical protein